MIDLKRLTPEQKELRRKILHISYIYKLSHLGSCLSVIDIIEAVYNVKKSNEKFILSNGHAGVALYAVLEKRGLMKISNLEAFDIHPDRNPRLGIDVSTGSLGLGLPIAVGMSLANRQQNYYCCISDGEMSEGSVFEAFRVAKEQKLSNLKIVVNANGWSAYDKLDTKVITRLLGAFFKKITHVEGHNVKDIEKALAMKVGNEPLAIIAHTTVFQQPFLKGLDAHYYVMTEDDYSMAIESLKNE